MTDIQRWGWKRYSKAQTVAATPTQPCLAWNTLLYHSLYKYTASFKMFLLKRSTAIVYYTWIWCSKTDWGTSSLLLLYHGTVSSDSIHSEWKYHHSYMQTRELSSWIYGKFRLWIWKNIHILNWNWIDPHPGSLKETKLKKTKTKNWIEKYWLGSSGWLNKFIWKVTL